MAVAVLLAAIAVITWYGFPRKEHPPGSLKFFSDDDGTTWFADDAKKLPPFQHGGKEAVLAKTYVQESDHKPFVAYLEKYTDEARAKLEAAGSTASPTHAGVSVTHAERNPASPLLVKKPHEGTWVAPDSPEGKKVMTITAPDGSKNYEPLAPD